MNLTILAWHLNMISLHAKITKMYCISCTYICFLLYIRIRGHCSSSTRTVTYLCVWTKCLHTLMYGTQKMINTVDEHQCTVISSYAHCRCRCVSAGSKTGSSKVRCVNVRFTLLRQTFRTRNERPRKKLRWPRISIKNRRLGKRS